MKSVMNGEPMICERIGKDEWFSNLQCCDCGLQHLFMFYRYKQQLIMVSYRDDYVTKFNRKNNRKKK